MPVTYLNPAPSSNRFPDPLTVTIDSFPDLLPYRNWQNICEFIDSLHMAPIILIVRLDRIL